jgi:putative transposase
MFKTIHLKVKNSDRKYFSRLFAEAKWFANTILASDEIVKFDTKQKTVWLTPECSEEVKFLSSQMRQEVKDQLISNMKGLNARKKRGYKVGKLKFKRIVNCIPLKNQTLRIKGKKVFFQGNKKAFNLFGTHQLPEDGQIQSARLLRNPFGIYLDLSVKIADELVEQKELPVIGVDFGIKDSLTFSDGTQFNPVFIETVKLIKQRHKRLSKKKKGSYRWKKCKYLLNKAYQKLDKEEVNARLKS